MKKQQREALAKIYDYAKFFGNHNPNIDTIFRKYKEAMKHISVAIYSHFGAFDEENDYMNDDLKNLNEAFAELEKLKDSI